MDPKIINIRKVIDHTILKWGNTRVSPPPLLSPPSAPKRKGLPRPQDAGGVAISWLTWTFLPLSHDKYHEIGTRLINNKTNTGSYLKKTVDRHSLIFFFFVLSLFVLFCFVCYSTYTVLNLSQWDFSSGKVGSLSPRKASCNRVARYPTIHNKFR